MTVPSTPTAEERLGHARSPSLLNHVIFRLAGAALVLAALLIIMVGYVTDREETALWRQRQCEAARSGAHGIASLLDRVEETLHFIVLLPPEDIAKSPTILRDPLTRYDSLAELVWMDSAGRIVGAATRADTVLADPTTAPSAPWFLQTLAGQPYRGVVLLTDGRDPYAVVAVRSAGGTTVAARLDFGLLRDMLGKMDFGDSGRAYIATAEGTVVASTDAATPAYSSVFGRPEFQGLSASPTDGWDGKYTNALGNEVAGAGHTVDGANWLVFTEFSQAETTAAARNTVTLLVAGFLAFAALITVTVTLRLRSDVFAPLEELRLAARAIGRGNLDHRLPAQHYKETARLADAYNEMAARLAEQRHALQRRAADLSAIHEVGVSLTADMDLQQVLHSVLGAVFKILPGIQNAHIFLLDNGALNFAASLLDDGTRDVQGYQLSPSGPTYQTAATGIPTYIADTTGHPLLPDTNPAGALAVVPLAIGARVLGVISVRHVRPHPHSPEEIHGLHLLADRIAVAIENARLYDQIRGELMRRRQSEAELSASEARYRAVVEDQTELIARFTPDGVLTFVNPALARAFSFAGPIEVGMNFLQFLPPPLRRDQLLRWAAYAPNNPRGETEPRMNTPGGLLWLAWTEHALFDSEGRLTEIQAVARDVSAARQAEDQVRQLNAELEERVAARTADLALANTSLQAEVAERHRAQGQISASLKEKELLLKEIHHRVKNNLQIIASLLSLQAAGPVDQAARELLRESQNRVRAMALIHEDLYRGGNLARIAIAAYLSGLTAQLVRTYRTTSHSVDLSLEVDEAMNVDLDQAIPCGLIVNELVTNALKYAFHNGRRGRLLVSLTRYPGSLLRLTVADDGPGLPPGLDWRNTDTLGLQLVTTLADQLGGAITLDQSQGAAFSIIFPGAPETAMTPEVTP